MTFDPLSAPLQRSLRNPAPVLVGAHAPEHERGLILERHAVERVAQRADHRQHRPLAVLGLVDRDVSGRRGQIRGSLR